MDSSLHLFMIDRKLLDEPKSPAKRWQGPTTSMHNADTMQPRRHATMQDSHAAVQPPCSRAATQATQASHYWYLTTSVCVMMTDEHDRLAKVARDTKSLTHTTHREHGSNEGLAVYEHDGRLKEVAGSLDRVQLDAGCAARGRAATQVGTIGKGWHNTKVCPANVQQSRERWAHSSTWQARERCASYGQHSRAAHLACRWTRPVPLK